MVETLHVTTVRSLFRNWQAGTGQAGRWTPFEVLEELDDHSILRFPVVAKRQDEGDREEYTRRGPRRACVMRFAEVTIASPITSEAYI